MSQHISAVDSIDDDVDSEAVDDDCDDIAGGEIVDGRQASLLSPF